MEKTPTKVFVSYAHDNTAHEEAVLEFCDELCSNFIDCNCDQYIDEENPERGWPHWMSENIRVSKYVVVVASKKYLERYEGREEAGKGLGVKWEAILSSSAVYLKDSTNMKFIPVFMKPEDAEFIPDFLLPFTHYDLSNSGRLDSLLKRLKGELVTRKPKLGSPFTKAKKILESSNEDCEVEVKEMAGILPKLPEFTDNMKPGMKILQAFFALPINNRFRIASELELLEIGETYLSENAEKISGQILIRAKEKEKLGDLWSKLFSDENVDPNPFKKNSQP